MADFLTLAKGSSALGATVGATAVSTRDRKEKFNPNLDLAHFINPKEQKGLGDRVFGQYA